MKQLLISLLALALVGIPTAVTPHAGVASATQAARAKTLTFDVAMDASTWSLNQVAPGAAAPARGDTFVVIGKIYPGGTIPPGGTPDNLSTFGPDTPGSVGTWVCSGTFFHDFAEIVAGAEPHVYTTQRFELDDGSVLVSEGPEGFAPTTRAVVGSIGRFASMRGNEMQTNLGFNETTPPGGLPGFNLHFVFALKK